LQCRKEGEERRNKVLEKEERRKLKQQGEEGRNKEKKEETRRGNKNQEEEEGTTRGRWREHRCKYGFLCAKEWH
jgi:hypothetical protein